MKKDLPQVYFNKAGQFYKRLVDFIEEIFCYSAFSSNLSMLCGILCDSCQIHEKITDDFKYIQLLFL